MKKGQVLKADDGSQLRIEEIEEVYYPFGDKTNQARARIMVTIGGEKQ
jgi:hypothetical protein